MSNPLPRFFLVISILISDLTYGEVVSVGASGFHIKIEAQVNVAPAVAYQQFLRVQEWWNSAHTWFGDAGNLSLEPVAGGCFCEQQGAQSVQHMTVSFVVPDKKLVMLGGLGPMQQMGLTGALSFTFVPITGLKTNIVQEYRVSGYHPDGFAELAKIVDQVQTVQLQGLTAKLTKP